MTVGAQDMREHRGVAGIRLPSGLSVTFPIARDRARIDRIHREPGLDQRDDDQVLVRLDRYRRVIHAAPMLCDQSQQRAESSSPSVDSAACHHDTVLIDQCDVVMGFRPVNPAGNAQSDLLVSFDSNFVELEAGAAT